MKWLITSPMALLCLLRRFWLLIYCKDPAIVYFKFDHFININDLSFCLRLKTKFAWKAELENIGRVRRNGIIVFNNKYQRASIKLRIYGRRNLACEYILDLNLKNIRLQGCSFDLTNQIEKDIQSINTHGELFLENLSASLNAVPWYNDITLPASSMTAAPSELTKIISLLAQDQKAFIKNNLNSYKPLLNIKYGKGRNSRILI